MKRNVSIAIAVIAVVMVVSAIALYSSNKPAPATNQTTTNQVPATNKPTGAAGLNPASQVTVISPLPDSTIASPLIITGEARGGWYFEASFPVELQDANGNVIAQGSAQAKSNWMTTEFVPFSVSLTFAKPATDTGTLIIKNANPSGNPQFASQLEIPVKF